MRFWKFFVASAYFLAAGSGAQPAVSGVQIQLPAPSHADVAYADQSPLQKLDLYLPPAADGPYPVVIWIHGGGFRFGDKRSMPRKDFGPAPKAVGPDGPYQIQVPDVGALTAKGYAVVSLNYRLDGSRSMRAATRMAIQDAKAAVRFLRANSVKYRLDERHIAVWGNSAGGYMAAMLAATGDQQTIFDDPALGNMDASSAVQAAVVWFGMMDERRLGEELSVTGYIRKARTLPAVLVANGDVDPVVNVGAARDLHNAFSAAGARSQLVVVPGAGHEDPLFMATQMQPTFDFLSNALAVR
nr:alpha/beta hydrolase [uncultured Dongia sp.]